VFKTEKSVLFSDVFIAQLFNARILAP